MTRLDFIRGVPLLDGLSEDHLRKIDGVAGEREVRSQDVLFRLGEEAYVLYIVRAGRVDLTFPVAVMGESKDVCLHTLEPGATLAWSALLPPHRFTMSARAATDVTLVSLEREAVFRLFEEESRLGFILMSNLARVVALRLHMVQALLVREVQRSVAQTYR